MVWLWTALAVCGVVALASIMALALVSRRARAHARWSERRIGELEEKLEEARRELREAETSLSSIREDPRAALALALEATRRSSAPEPGRSRMSRAGASAAPLASEEERQRSGSPEARTGRMRDRR
jgi:hypothetical protein